MCISKAFPLELLDTLDQESLHTNQVVCIATTWQNRYMPYRLLLILRNVVAPFVLKLDVVMMWFFNLLETFQIFITFKQDGLIHIQVNQVLHLPCR